MKQPTDDTTCLISLGRPLVTPVTMAVVFSLSVALSGCVTARPGTTNDTQGLSKQAELQRAREQAQLREDAALRRAQADADSGLPEAAAGMGTQQKGKSKPAVLALLKEATAAQKEGNSNRSNLLLERALRIDPADAATYHALAGLRLATSNDSQAIAFARRGLTLNPAPELREQLQEIIREATDRASVLQDS